MKGRILVIVIGIILIAGGIVAYQKIVLGKKVHYHAGFKVYVNGKLQDFGEGKYMSLLPCGESDGHNEQLEKAHLHDLVGTVVHVHRNGAKWKDLFQNINYKIDPSVISLVYINGRQEDEILNKSIEPYESVIILIGTYDPKKNYVKEAVTKQEIQSQEKKSESCGA